MAAAPSSAASARVTLRSLYDDWEDLAPLAATLREYLTDEQAYAAVQAVATDELIEVRVDRTRLEAFVEAMRGFDIVAKPQEASSTP